MSDAEEYRKKKESLLNRQHGLDHQLIRELRSHRYWKSVDAKTSESVEQKEVETLKAEIDVAHTQEKLKLVKAALEELEEEYRQSATPAAPLSITDPASVSRTPDYAAIRFDSASTGVRYSIEECIRF